MDRALLFLATTLAIGQVHQLGERLDRLEGIEGGPRQTLQVDKTGNPWFVDTNPLFICETDAACAPTGARDFTGAVWTKPFRRVATLPATCEESEVVLTTDARLRVCLAGSWEVPK